MSLLMLRLSHSAAAESSSPSALSKRCSKLQKLRVLKGRVRRESETHEAYSSRLETTISRALTELDEAPLNVNIPSLRRILTFLTLTIGINLAGAFLFRSAELNLELKNARGSRKKYRHFMPRVVGGAGNNTYMMDPEDQEHVAQAVDVMLRAKFETSFRCGMCAKAVSLADGSNGIGLEEYQAEFWRWTTKICRNEADALKHCQWRFLGSFYFTMTVITTIGYGSFAPLTTSGKVLVVLFVFFGSQLAFLLYTLIGTRVVYEVNRFVRNRVSLVMSVFSIAYVFLGGLLFQFMERNLRGNDEFTFWNSTYFVVQTLLTLGLGDFTPSIHSHSLCAAWVYTIFGLAVLGATLSALTTDLFALEKRLRGKKKQQQPEGLDDESDDGDGDDEASLSYFGIGPPSNAPQPPARQRRRRRRYPPANERHYSSGDELSLRQQDDDVSSPSSEHRHVTLRLPGDIERRGSAASLNNTLEDPDLFHSEDGKETTTPPVVLYPRPSARRVLTVSQQEK